MTNRSEAVAAFINEQSPVLAEGISAYVRGAQTHVDLQRVVERVFETWDASKLNEMLEVPCERPFWCALWAAQHLASPSHAYPKAIEELSLLAEVLRGNRELPASYSGHRP